MRLPIHKIPLHIQILTALLLGFCFGYFLPSWTEYTNWAGVVFLRILNMVVIPLILCSIIFGVSSLSQSANMKRISLKVIGYYILTTLLAIITGFALVSILKPGAGVPLNLTGNVEKLNVTADKISEIVLNIVPKNIFEALAQGQMLPVIFFAVIFGFFLTKVDNKSQTFLRSFFESALEVIMKITLFVIKLAPYGIFSIAAGEIARQVQMGNDISDLLSRLGIYMLIVIGGLLFHGLVTLSLTLKLFANINPWKHFRNMTTPLITAFTTSSSNATLPLTMEAVEKKSGVSPRIAGFTIPLGAIINMNGTALYECVAVFFIAQVYDIDLTLGQQLIIIFTSLLAAVGAAGVPMAGLVMMVIILRSVGLPLEGIGLILPVDRVLDMFRTAVNTYGDTCAAVIVAKSEGEELL